MIVMNALNLNMSFIVLVNRLLIDLKRLMGKDVTVQIQIPIKEYPDIPIGFFGWHSQ